MNEWNLGWVLSLVESLWGEELCGIVEALWYDCLQREARLHGEQNEGAEKQAQEWMAASCTRVLCEHFGLCIEITIFFLAPEATLGSDAAPANEDERRLAQLGYKQEYTRIFNTWTNFGLTTSMVSVLLGIVPLYTYSLQTGGVSSLPSP